MNIENCRLALNLGGSDAPGTDDPGMILAAASRGAVRGALIAAAIADLVASGAIVTLEPLVIDGGHVDWTPFFLELMARGDLGAAAEVRRRAEDTTRGGESHWIEICAALHETPFEFHGSNLERRERPYADLLPLGEDIIAASIRPFVAGEFAQPVAQVKKSSESVTPAVTKTSTKKAAKTSAKKSAK